MKEIDKSKIYIVPKERITNEDKIEMTNLLCHWCCKDLVDLIISLGEGYEFIIKEYPNGKTSNS